MTVLPLCWRMKLNLVAKWNYSALFNSLLLTARSPDFAKMLVDRRNAAPLLLVSRPDGSVQPVSQRLHFLVAAAAAAEVSHGGVECPLRGQEVGVLGQLGGEPVLSAADGDLLPELPLDGGLDAHDQLDEVLQRS